MEARAKIPPTLPRFNPTQSYWQTPPSHLATYRSAETLPESADYVIIGSGITGTMCAWNLLDKLGHGREQGDDDGKPSVVMLEAREVCSGATGRNGGHTKHASYRHFPANAFLLGIKEAAKIARFEYSNMQAIHAFIAQHKIDCDAITCPTIDVIYSQRQWDEAVRAIEMLRQAMPHDLDGAAKYDFLDEEEVRKEYLCDGEDKIHGAVRYQAGSLSAYKFVCGVLEMCLQRGLELYTRTPVIDLMSTPNTSSKSTWQVVTREGIIYAKQVLLATNAYTAFLRPDLLGSIVPLRGQVTAHRPGSHMPKTGLKTTYSFIYDKGYEYMISRPPGSLHEGDIIIGGGLAHALDNGLDEYGNTDDTLLNHEISAYLRNTTMRYFGRSLGDDHRDGRIRAEWNGIMGYSPDGFPFVGKMPGEVGLWIAAAFQGHGMVLCFLCAKALVGMISGGDDDFENGVKSENDDFDAWFPSVYRITKERLAKDFKGRLHVNADEFELQAQK